MNPHPDSIPDRQAETAQTHGFDELSNGHVSGDSSESSEVAGQDPYLAEEPQVVDEPDVPADPDAGTLAAAEAARASLQPWAPRRKFKSPHNLLVLGLIMGCVVAMGIYAFTWAMRIAANSDKADLRLLEERDVMAKWQEEYKVLKYGKGSDIAPPSLIYVPLTPTEKQTMEYLRAHHGTQFVPSERQQSLIDQVKELRAVYGVSSTRPSSAPSTRP